MNTHLSASSLYASNPFQVSAKYWLEPRFAVFALTLCLAGLTFVQAARADDVTFSKSRYSSVKQPKEADVVLTITDSKVLIKAKEGKKAKNDTPLGLEIPFSSIDSMSYELATRHRVSEGAGVMVLSLGAGAVLMATKTKSHWLDIESHDGDVKQVTILRLDKSEYEQVISTLEARTGKHIAVLDSKTSTFNPTAGSKDMDQVVPFRMDTVAAALKPAMESMGCQVKQAKPRQIECKRPWAKGRSDAERTGSGGEKVIAKLDAKGEQTRVRISTEKGFVGHMVKKNWSTPIYEEMLKQLQKPAQSAAVSRPN
jgi:hypothetical protein